MKRPDLNQVPSPFHKYIDLVAGDDFISMLPETKKDMQDFLSAIPETKWDFRYAEGKWSIKELVQHLIDTDRIFAYRALCIARGETASLPGFDENNYAAASKGAQRTKDSLLQEFSSVLEANALLFRSFDEAQLDRFGTANNNPIQVRALGFISIGHLCHHKNVLLEKYLQQPS